MTRAGGDRGVWPWEHLAVGYLLYSALARWRGDPPGREALVLAVGTQFPDLVDKTLGWVLGVLPGGLTLAHSLLFAIPAVAVVLAVTRNTDAQEAGVAFGVGYLSHLPGDVLYPALLGEGLAVRFLFWPLVPASPASTDDVLALVQSLFAEFLAYLATPAGRLYIALEFTLLSAAFVVWVLDGCPGLGVVAPGSPDG